MRRWALPVAITVAGLALLGGSSARTRPVRLAGWAFLAAGTAGSPDRTRRTNRLAHEKSPYLLQHATNPVDWYPWGEEAFARASREHKPIFLSIGYSTCHWCHVMERESFENETVAAALNRDFVAIKVDREERPDIDRIYMTAMQAMGLGGGWPLNVFLTPERVPFYGGTYFPPGSPGRPGLLQLLPQIHDAWIHRRADIEKDGARVMEALASLDTAATPVADRGPLLDRAFHDFAAVQDAAHGGFGHAPKFPSVAHLDFLMRYWASDPAARGEALAMVRRQLDAMQAGGIHDQLGGGFHRYSTDSVWLIPHFEKMLYDQALLARVYLDAFQATRDPAYAETARDLLDYVARDLTSPEGAFDSAEDADSEGEEGKFYVWTSAEIDAVVGPADGALVAARYGITPAGNFEGSNILHRSRSLAEVAVGAGISEAEARARLSAAREQLLAARGHRIRPHRDDKVIVAWNGLMISAFARAARVLGSDRAAAQEYARRATRAAEFCWDRLRDPRTGALSRRYRDGETAGAGQLDDYAYYVFGLIDLYGATFDARWLDRARTLTSAMLERFDDPRDGGFFTSPPGDPSLQIRMKEGYDGAELAGGSIAAYDLQLLATLLDRDDWRARAERALDYYAGRLAPGPTSMARMLVALDLAGASPRHVVIAGSPDAADTRAMIAAFDKSFRPHALLLLADGGAGQKSLAAIAPFTSALSAHGGKATAYVCVGYSCQLPTTDPGQFTAQLEGAMPTAGRAH